MSNQSEETESLNNLPLALIGTIMTKLDVASLCSIASTCSNFRHSASHILSFIPNFHLIEVAPTMELLRPLLPPNPYLKSLKLDCRQLDDSSIGLIVRPSINELCLHNCADFSGKLLSAIGGKCRDLRTLYLGSVAEKRGRAIHITDLEELLSGCSQLQALVLMFDVSLFVRHNFAQIWALASEKLTSLEIGYVSSITVAELLSPNLVFDQSPNRVTTPILPGIRELCLSVDYITDDLIRTISCGLPTLTHLDLRDAPLIEPRATFDLTDCGLQLINLNGKLKHLSLVRSQEFLITYFSRVSDIGLLLMADKCANMESIRLGGFCRVTDSGFKTVLHSCSRLYTLKVSHGNLLTDLVFHDMSATSLSLTHVSFRWCHLLTNHAIEKLVLNTRLELLDLRDCKSIGDEALSAIRILPGLKVLKLDGLDISDSGLSCLRGGVITSLLSLSVKGCKRLTDKCISTLFEGSFNLKLRELDLSNLPNLSDNGILSLAKSRVPISELRMRQCHQIGDTSVMALASMQVDENRWYGSNLQLLDLFNCGITQLAFRWLKKPYFPRLRWLGVTGSVNRDIVDALAKSRPFLRVACHGEELGADQWDNSGGLLMHDFDEPDEPEQWNFAGDGDDDEEMSDAENNGEEE